MLLDEVLDVRFGDEDPEEYRKVVSKASGEMAMLLRLAARALPDERDAATICGLAHDLAPLARAPHVRRTLFLRPSRASMYALAHFCLTELGIPDEGLDRVARLALHSSANAANERVPYRMLDAAWTRHLAFGDAELGHPAIPLSPLGAGVDLLEASAEDAYAFTHALPYVTDFGRVALPQGLDTRQLLGIAEALAVKALDEDDLDVLAEVLMAPAILRAGWTPTLGFAWEVLQRVWTEFGFVPGPGIPSPPASGETRIRHVRRVLGTVYHTTFAAGLCCATLVACEAAPPETEDASPGTMDAPPGKGEAWKVNWNGCAQERRESLAFLRLAFALRRAIEVVDLVRVRELLTSAAALDLLEHPLFIQALELLERVGASAPGSCREQERVDRTPP
ncbi:MAG: DUF6895 family protein [Caldimonas sp.]